MKRKTQPSPVASLASLPVDVAALDRAVASALVAADRERTVDSCDAAREATFPFLEAVEHPAYAQHAAAYAAASIFWADARLRSTTTDPVHVEQAASDAMRALDLAMLRGGIDDWARHAEPLILAAGRLQRAASERDSAVSGAQRTTPSPSKSDAATQRRQRFEASCPHFSVDGTPIPRVDARTLSTEAFREQYMEGSVDVPPRPVILCGAIDGWPALRRWTTAYLAEQAGARLVPVETYAAEDATSTYLSESWAQRVMSLADYIRRYVDVEQSGGDGGGEEGDGGDGGGGGGSEEGGGSGEGGDERGEGEDDASTARGYLAQHQLFDQIPSLRDDICTPPFCTARTAEDKAAPAACDQQLTPIVSAWFGPAGTVSPLHTDPYHNTLAQVVGHKYVRLYDARHTPRLYPRSGALCNNCFVDLDTPQPAAQPLFEGTPFMQCVLAPGELLYIPRLCWHYVRSLETSLSVSFWWGCKMALVMRDGKPQAAY